MILKALKDRKRCWFIVTLRGLEDKKHDGFRRMLRQFVGSQAGNSLPDNVIVLELQD